VRIRSERAPRRFDLPEFPNCVVNVRISDFSVHVVSRTMPSHCFSAGNALSVCKTIEPVTTQADIE
jgi:hypothetical protein